jgi:hypothetical protein
VGGRDNPGVHPNRLRAPKPLDLPLLEDTKELDLDVGRQITNLIQEDGRTIRQLEAPDLPRDSVSKRALLTAEQFAFDERGWHRGAIDPHHGVRPPRAQLVNPGRKEFLPRAGFAEEQHGCVGRRHLMHLFEHASNRRALSDEGAGGGRGSVRPYPAVAVDHLCLELPLVPVCRNRANSRVGFTRHVKPLSPCSLRFP